MIRFRSALGLALLGSLIAPWMASGQDSKAEAPVQEKPVVLTEVFDPSLVGTANDVLEYVEVDDQAKKPDAPKAPGSNPAPRFRTYSYAAPMTVAKVQDALEANFGLSLSEADDALRAQLEIPPGQGVVVVGVKAASLADQAGLKRSDVLLELGDRKASEVLQVRKTLLGLKKEALEVKLIRKGEPTRLSLVGPEHGFPSEVSEFWIGVPVSPVDATLRAHLTSLPADSGLIVNEVVKGSPAEQAAVRKNDILVSLGGKPLKASEDLIAQIQASKGKPVPLEVLRAGKPLTITVTPAKRQDSSVVNLYTPTLDGQSKAAIKYRVVRPNMAIEVEPRSDTGMPGQVKSPTQTPQAKQPQTINVTPFAFNEIRKTTGSAVATNPNAGQSLAGTTSFQFQLPENGPGREPASGRIEAQLKEISAKLEELTKALDGLKKPIEK